LISRGWLWLFTLIPSEYAAEKQYSDTGVFITQLFFPVCTKPERFLTRHFLYYEDGTIAEELAFYFLDLSHPERFFGYLGTNILGVSNLFVKNKDMKNFLTDH